MTKPSPRPAPPWMRVALIASLAVNLAVAGLVAGAYFRGDGNRPPEERLARDLGGAPFIRALPKEDQRAVLRRIWRNRDTVREGRASLRKRLGTLMTVLAADTFDRARVEDLLAEQRAQMGARQSLGEAAFLDHFETLSQAERVAYVESLRKSLRRRNRRN